MSSTEQNNIVTFALQASFKNPEVAAKEAEAAARKPLPRLDRGRRARRPGRAGGKVGSHG